MLFNSIEFAIFLPVAFLLYWFVFSQKPKVQNAFVVAASYFFYGCWDWRFLLLILFTSLCSFFSGLGIAKYKETRWAKGINIANIVVNLLVLGLFKYYDFFATSLSVLFPALQGERLLLHLILPVGISFYTFQALSYSIDVYRGSLPPTRDCISFLAFMSFFPQLVAGPIERASNLLPQFQTKRTFSADQAGKGLSQMLWGFFKKMVVADRCAIYVDQVFAAPDQASSLQLVLGALLFTIQIYGDFSGYSDIAIGCAKLFGIRLRRNFNVPYFSRDIAEFWRRWHISLTSWFRDYVYIPLGGSRVGKGKIVRNTFVIFLLSGLWHGANWTFLAWGAYHALLFLPLILLGRNRKHTDIVAACRRPTLRESLQMLLTFVLCAIGWVLFRADSIAQAAQYLFGIVNNSGALPIEMPWLAIGFSLLMLIVEWFTRADAHALELPKIKHRAVRWGIYYAVALCIVVFAATGANFIYFQF